jgi:hypothetical protein
MPVSGSHTGHPWPSEQSSCKILSQISLKIAAIGEPTMIKGADPASSLLSKILREMCYVLF